MTEQQIPTAAVLRGAVVGLGIMGTNHLRVLANLPGVHVAAAIDPDPERRSQTAHAHGGLTAYASLAEALEHDELDFACVATPVGVLPELTHEALAAGLHVLVEKPTAPDEASGRAMAADARSRGLLLGVGHVERANPAVVALRCKLDDGAIGHVLQMHARRLSPFPNREGSPGVALDLATHDIDVMRYITGDEVQRVFAETASPLMGPTEDLLCATLRFDGGATGLVETNWMTPTKVRQLSVLGERGMLVVDYLTQDLYLYEHPTRATEWDAMAGIRGGGEGNMVRFALDRKEPLRVEWQGFLDAVRSGSAAPVSADDGIAALSIAQAIRAAGQGHDVVVPGYRTAVHVAA